MRGRTRKSRLNSASRSRSAASGVKRFTAGSAPRKSTRSTRRRTTTSRSPTSTKATSIKPASPTRKRWNSNRTTRSSNRTTSSSRKSMTGRLARIARTARITRILSSVAAALFIAGCTNYYEIPIETPIKPKLDVSAFQRVLVAGFIAGGTDDVDGNLETTRLLRSQLRTKSDLRVIDTDVLPLMEVATETPGTPEAKVEPPTRRDPAAEGREGKQGKDTREGKTEAKADPKGEAPQAATPEKPSAIKDPKDLEPYEHIFADVEYWKKIGEEYQNPLIVTG